MLVCGNSLRTLLPRFMLFLPVHYQERAVLLRSLLILTAVAQRYLQKECGTDRDDAGTGMKYPGIQTYLWLKQTR